ncbi:hypothetical protein [Peterkaempfera sp. SMS 1(5)a]|uniref:zinc finger domain-containing protein n=1 Tax=Peterkaempfera podocarpi TaxID=3232308 RepID=UPI00366D09BF
MTSVNVPRPTAVNQRLQRLTPDQLDALVAKTRNRALTETEHTALRREIDALQQARRSLGGAQAAARTATEQLKQARRQLATVTPLTVAQVLEVTCPLDTCRAAPGRRCHSAYGMTARNPHSARTEAARKAKTP